MAPEKRIAHRKVWRSRRPFEKGLVIFHTSANPPLRYVMLIYSRLRSYELHSAREVEPGLAEIPSLLKVLLTEKTNIAEHLLNTNLSHN